MAPAGRHVAASLGAAALFGLSAPLAKLLLSEAEPLALAPLLYLGAGMGLTLGATLRGRATRRDREAPIRGADGWLLAAIWANASARGRPRQARSWQLG